MDIRELISFYHTARYRSVSRAAAQLQIGQPTVTTHLQRLEREFSIQLFDRIKRPIRLTAEGAAFLELVSPIVEAVEQGLDSLKTRMNHPGHLGSFTIGAYPDLALHYLPQVIKEYREQYPEVQIKLVARSYAFLMEMLAAGEVDLALVHAPERDDRSLAFRRLFESPFALVTPLEHPLLEEKEPPLQSIVRWPLVLLSRNSYIRRYLERAFREAGLSYHLALEVDHTELIKRYVEIGMGVAITQEFDLVPEDEGKLGLVRLGHLFAPVQIGVVTLQGKFLSRAALNFIDTLIELADRLGPERQRDRAV